jgi:hypothetical protein
MGYVQLAFGIISLIFSIIGAAKTAVPIIENYVQKQQTAQKPFYSVYQGNDPFYNYWSDDTGRFWVRVDVYGKVEYAENPNLIILN